MSDLPTPERWAWSANEEFFDGDYASRAEAAELGPEEYDDPSSWGPGDPRGWTGRIVSSPVDEWVAQHAETLTDRVAEHAYEAVGDLADGWVGRLPADDLRALGVEMASAFRRWMSATGREPKFFVVVDVRPGAVRDE